MLVISQSVKIDIGKMNVNNPNHELTETSITLEDFEEYGNSTGKALKGKRDYALPKANITFLAVQVSINYWEAMTIIDPPVYEMTLLDKDGNILDSISFNAFDVYSHTDIHNHILQLEIPVDVETTSDIIVQYKVSLEVRHLRIISRSGEPVELDKSTAEIDLYLHIPADTTFEEIGEGLYSLDLKCIIGAFETILGDETVKNLDTGYLINKSRIKPVVLTQDIIQQETRLNQRQEAYLIEVIPGLQQISTNSYIPMGYTGPGPHEIGWNTIFNIELEGEIPAHTENILFTNEVEEVWKYASGKKRRTVKIKEFAISDPYSPSQLVTQLRHLFYDRGNWKWYKEFQVYGAEYIHPHLTEREYKWTTKLINADTDDLIKQSMMTILVKVPQSKLDAAADSEMLASGQQYVKIVGFVIGVAAGIVIGAYIINPYVGIAVSIGLFILGFIIGECIGNERERANRKAMECSRPFDNKFQEVVDFNEVIDAVYIENPDYPQILNEYFTAIIKLGKLTELINTTFTKYLSSEKSEDFEAIELQKEAVESVMSYVESYLLYIRDHYEEVKGTVVKKECEFTDISGEIEKLKEEGLSDETRDLMIEAGLSDKDIKDFEDRLKDFNLTEESYNNFYEEDLPNRLERDYKNSHDCYFDNLHINREISRIFNLDGSDKLIALLNYGLFTYEEFLEKFKTTGMNHSIQILEDIITPEGIDDLNNIGINTTFKLLKESRTRTNRKNLKKKLEKKYDILTWANLSDLLRIQNIKTKEVMNLATIDSLGIDEEEAVVLEKAGVDTIKELAVRNPVNLHKKLNKIWEEMTEENKPPELDEVKDWIEQAKLLEPMLSY